MYISASKPQTGSARSPGIMAQIVFSGGSGCMNRLSGKLLFARALTILIFAVLAHGQGAGTIVGTVTDPSGAVIPSAAVKVKQSQTGLERATMTNPQGYFVVPLLQPSQYEVNITARGF